MVRFLQLALLQKNKLRQGSKNFNWSVVMNKKMIGIILGGLTLATVAIAGGYRAGTGTDGLEHCYEMDANGTVYGDGVADSLCAAGYKVTLGSTDGINHCYEYDSRGVLYGNPVNDNFCTASYRAGQGQDGFNHCYRSDASGVLFGGDAVSDNLCTATYRAAGGNDGLEHCYAVDARGVAFGNAVADSLCQ